MLKDSYYLYANDYEFFGRTYRGHYLHDFIGNMLAEESISIGNVYKNPISILLKSVSLPNKKYCISESLFHVPALGKFLLKKPKILVNIFGGPFLQLLMIGKAGLAGKIAQYFFSRIDYGIVFSTKQQNYLKEKYSIPSKIITPFVQQEERSKILELKKNGIKKPEEKIVISHITSALGYYVKNTKNVIKAFQIAKKKEPKLELRVIGDLPEIKKPIINGVEFLGRVNDVVYCLSESHIYIHPAFAESFSISTLIAAMLDCKIICSENMGVVEALPPNVAEVLDEKYIKSPEALAEMLINQAKNLTNHQVPISFIENFNEKKCAALIKEAEDIIQQL